MKHFGAGGVLSNPWNISLRHNTDGVAVFSSPAKDIINARYLSDSAKWWNNSLQSICIVWSVWHTGKKQHTWFCKPQGTVCLHSLPKSRESFENWKRLSMRETCIMMNTNIHVSRYRKNHWRVANHRNQPTNHKKNDSRETLWQNWYVTPVHNDFYCDLSSVSAPAKADKCMLVC